MKARARIDVDDVPLEITITMTRKQWREILGQMPTGWPSWKLGVLLSDVLRQVTQATDQTMESREQ